MKANINKILYIKHRRGNKYYKQKNRSKQFHLPIWFGGKKKS